jgi:hypothetical protein
MNMEKPTFKMADAGKTIELKVEDSIVIPEVVQPTLVLAEVMPTVRPRAFYVASQWNILPAEGVDMIEAINNSTGDKYTGSISDFNKMLKGE